MVFPLSLLLIQCHVHTVYMFSHTDKEGGEGDWEQVCVSLPRRPHRALSLVLEQRMFRFTHTTHAHYSHAHYSRTLLTHTTHTRYSHTLLTHTTQLICTRPCCLCAGVWLPEAGVPPDSLRAVVRRLRGRPDSRERVGAPTQETNSMYAPHPFILLAFKTGHTTCTHTHTHTSGLRRLVRDSGIQPRVTI